MTAPAPDQTHWDDLETIQQRFEALWDEGRRPNLGAFLQQYARHPQRRALTFRLVRADLWKRLKAGDVAPLVQDYLARYPDDLERDRQLELIQLEYKWRWQLGDIKARRDEYRCHRDFAAFAADLAGLVPVWNCRNPHCIRRRGHRLADENEAETVCPACGTRFKVADLFRPPEPGRLDGRKYDLPEAPLASGGMGQIYLVRDPGLGRELALKVVHPDWKGKPQVERRLEREARIVGGLQHPAIVPVHNLGRLPDGRLHFTMKLIRGRKKQVRGEDAWVQTLADELKYREGVADELPRFVAVFEQVCQAIAFAHKNKVIHRDLKPPNVMVGEFGEVQVMDWGLAKELEGDPNEEEDALHERKSLLKTVTDGGPSLRNSLTQAGQVLGSLLYLAPEQARGDTAEHGPRSDVFALGAILCEILTGIPPYPDAGEEKYLMPGGDRLDGAEVFAQQLLERARAGETGPGLRRLKECKADTDLVEIARACLARDLASRPADASDVAARVAKYQADVRQRAEDERVQREKREEAEKREKAERLAREESDKRARASRRALRFAIVVVVLLVAGAAGAVFGALIFSEQAEANRLLAIKEQDARGMAEKNLGAAKESQKEAEERLVRRYVATGVQALENNDYLGALPWFAEALKLERGGPLREEMHRVRLACVLERCPRLLNVWADGGEIADVQVSPDGRRVVTGADAFYEGRPNQNRVWDVASGIPVTPPLRLGGGVNRVFFIADGRYVLTVGDRLEMKAGKYTVEARTWDAATGQPITPVVEYKGRLSAVAIRPDGREATVAVGEKVYRWDTRTGEALCTLDTGSGVKHVAFSPHGRRLVTAHFDGTARAWRADGKLVMATPAHGYWVNHAEFSPDGSCILTAVREKSDLEGAAYLWDATTGKSLLPPLMHSGSVGAAHFSPDGSRALTFSAKDRTARVWNLRTGKLLFAPIHHPEGVADAAFSPDGRWVIMACYDNTVRLWDASTGAPLAPPLKHIHRVNRVAFSPDGRHLATASRDQTARLWELPRQGPEAVFLEGIRRLANPDPYRPLPVSFGAGGKRVAMPAGWSAGVWNPTTGRLACPLLSHRAYVTCIALSPDGSRAITAGQDGIARIWDTNTGKECSGPLQHGGPVNDVEFSPDGHLVVTAGGHKSAQLWDAVTGQSVGELPHAGGVQHTAFSPDGRLVVTVGDKTAQVWDARSRTPVGQPLLHDSFVRYALFSPDAAQILTATLTRVYVWDIGTGKPVGKPLAHSSGLLLGHILWAAFSPEGDRVLTTTLDVAPGRAEVRIWNARTGEALAPTLNHKERILYATFSPNGRMVATASDDHTARVWDATTGEPLTPPLKHPGDVQHALFSLDGRRLVTVCADAGLRTWNLRPDDRPVDDLVSLAELLAGTRVDPTGGGLLLPVSKLPPKLSLLRSKFPEEFRFRSDELPSWHRQAAAACEEKGEWFAARWHLDRLVPVSAAVDITLLHTFQGLWRLVAIGEAGPLDEWLHRCANADAELGRWQRARAELGSATRIRPTPLRVFALGLLDRKCADHEAYRRRCADLFRRFGRPDSPDLAWFVARACALSPAPGVDPEAVLKLAEKAVKSNPQARDYLITLGAARYRAGKFDEAVAVLKAVAKTSQASERERVMTSLLMGMAYCRLGRMQESRRQLDLASTSLAKAVEVKPQGSRIAGRYLTDWHVRLAITLLHEEASALFETMQPRADERGKGLFRVPAGGNPE